MDDERIQEFWARARGRADVGFLEVLMGPDWGAAVAPPAWSFGDNPELADDLVARLLSGAKCATTGLKQAYDDEGEPVPKRGDLSIVLDGAGEPRALVRTTEVQIVPFSAVTESQAAAEGEGDGTLEAWRTAHRAFWERAGYTVGDDSPVVWERLALVYAG